MISLPVPSISSTILGSVHEPSSSFVIGPLSPHGNNFPDQSKDASLHSPFLPSIPDFSRRLVLGAGGRRRVVSLLAGPTQPSPARWDHPGERPRSPGGGPAGRQRSSSPARPIAGRSFFCPGLCDRARSLVADGSKPAAGVWRAL